MPADPAFHSSVMEMLTPLEGISSKSMFGGYGIFAEGSMFALVSGSALFFKVDDSNRPRFDAVDSKPYGSMPYYRVPVEVLEDHAELLDWAQASIAVAHSAPKKKR